jgi:hypothetical protein
MAQKYPKVAQLATHRSEPHNSSSAPLVRIRAPEIAPPLAAEPDERRFCGIRYLDCYRYLDTVKYLSKGAISEADQHWLRSHCKHLDIRQHGDWLDPQSGTPYQVNIHPWRFRIEIHLPDDDALGYFAKRRGVKVTAAHVARDFTFDDASGKWAMLELFDNHFVQRWQRKWKRISFNNGGMSTGRRGKGSYLTCYVSKPCRIDGIVDCFHGEGRHHGTSALAQIGIHSPADLLHFDHAGYWGQQDQRLKEIDKQRLGRYIRNRMRNTRDQQADHLDMRLGGLLFRIHSIDQFGNASVQHFIRQYPRCRVAKNIIRTVDTETARP